MQQHHHRRGGKCVIEKVWLIWQIAVWKHWNVSCLSQRTVWYLWHSCHLDMTTHLHDRTMQCHRGFITVHLFRLCILHPLPDCCWHQSPGSTSAKCWAHTRPLSQGWQTDSGGGCHVKRDGIESLCVSVQPCVGLFWKSARCTRHVDKEKGRQDWRATKKNSNENWVKLLHGETLRESVYLY